MCGLNTKVTLATTTQSVSLTATPALVDTGGKAGEELFFSLQLTNNSDAILPIHMSARDSRSRQGQAEEIMQSLSAKDWVTYSEPDFILQAGEVTVVQIALQIPEDANPGGYYADLAIQALNLEREGSVIAMQPELVVQLLVTVTGEIKRDLRANLDSPSTVITHASTGSSIAYVVANQGNIHTLFTPTLYIERDEDVVAVESPAEIVLPNESRRIIFEVPASLGIGVYTARMQLDTGASIKELVGQSVQLIVLPFDPKLLLSIPLAGIAAYLYCIRRRIALAVVVITK